MSKISQLYRQYLFPRILDQVMAIPAMTQQRRELLAGVQGEVLEIGFGTGLNLAHYPAIVQQLTVIDVNPGMQALARPRMEASGIAIQSAVLSGEQLPMPDGSFDCVVSTWTLCSIAQVEQAIKEIYRVLRPGGKFFFIEHGLSDRPEVQRCQHVLTPIQTIIADGCHLDRPIQTLIEAQFSQVSLDRFWMEGLPNFVGYTYKGVATK